MENEEKKSLESLKKFFFVIVSVVEELAIWAITLVALVFVNIELLGVDAMGTQESENDALAALFALIACVVCMGSIFLGGWTYEKLENKYC